MQTSRCPGRLLGAAGLLAVALLAAACTSTNANTQSDGKAGAGGGTAFQFVDSSEIPQGDSPSLGPVDAPVTIVEFGDFQCPFCAKGADRLKKIRQNFGDDVRIVFKHFPLPFHKQAEEAARAAMAAARQDAFWEMHELLYDKQDQFKAGSMKSLTAKWAGQLGLDVAQFKKDYGKETWDKRIDRDKSLGKKLGVRGTPSYFINGEKMVGAQPYSKFESVVSQRIAQANRLREDGTPPGKIYKKAVARNLGDDDEDSGEEEPKNEEAITHVPVDADDPVRGGGDGTLVTLVVFSEFQCADCKETVELLDKVEAKYGERVRVVFKHRPLGYHQHAERAARAAAAAGEQGEFWAMHDLMYENQHQLGRPNLYESLADELGLDVSKFRDALDSQRIAEQVDADNQAANEAGVNTTPTYFVNGIRLPGDAPYSRFVEVIDQQLKLARKIREAEMGADALYKAVVEANKKGESVDRRDRDTGDKRADRVDRSKLKVGDSPTKGPSDAPVTIYEFSDFQCPYCGHAFHTLHDKILNKAKYDGKIRVVHKNFPLAFHGEAKPAAKAALAAQRQGKFWAMYEKLFENQKKFSSSNYAKWAKQLGLNVKKFKKDLRDSALDKRIREDKKMGKSVGVRGTPSFFVNGYRIVGAQDASKFEEIIDKALEEAE